MLSMAGGGSRLPLSEARGSEAGLSCLKARGVRDRSLLLLQERLTQVLDRSELGSGVGEKDIKFIFRYSRMGEICEG